MGTYINTLLYTAGGDLARPTKFRVMFSDVGTDFNIVPNRDFDLLCKTFSIPERKITVLDYKYKGKSVPIAGPYDVDHTLSMTFILDEGHKVRKHFEDWMMAMDLTNIGGSITALTNSIVGVNLLSKKKDIVISALNWSEDTEVYTYAFYGIYPISIGELSYATDSASTTQELTIQFGYTQYYSERTGIDLLDSLTGALNNGIASAKEFLSNGAQTLLNSGLGAIGTSSKEITNSLTKATDIFGNGW